MGVKSKRFGKILSFLAFLFNFCLQAVVVYVIQGIVHEGQRGIGKGEQSGQEVFSI